MNTSSYSNTTEPVPTASSGMRTDAKIWAYGGATLLVVGTVGNVLSASVMMRKPLRKTATSLYLTILAITDLTILYTVLMTLCLYNVFGISAFNVSEVLCQGTYFWMYWIMLFEAWILTSVAVERFVATFAPVFYKSWYTRKFVLLQLLVTGLLCAILDLGLTWRYDLTDEGCKLADLLVTKIVGYIDLVAASMLPSLIMLSCNICIAVKLAYHRFNQNPTSNQPRLNVKFMTIVLMMVTVVFLVTSIPMTIFVYQSQSLYAQAQASSPDEVLQIDIIYAALFILYFANFTVNFFMYCLSGRRFREEMMKLFCKRTSRVAPTSSSTQQVGVTVA